VKDVAGNALSSDKTWSFTTATANGGGTSEVVEVPAVADTYVSSEAPGTNFGTSTMLGVDASPAEVTYVKFNLPAAPAGKTLQGAKLELYSAGSGSTGTQNIKLVSNDGWTETGTDTAITYNNRPTLGTGIGTLSAPSTNTLYSVSLNANAVAGELGQPLSLGLDSSSSDGLDLNSREVAGKAPKLVLTFG
jgi:hypothetical protein